MRKQKTKAVDVEEEVDETREAWKARMQSVYSNYKYPALRALVSYYYENQERQDGILFTMSYLSFGAGVKYSF